MYIIKIHRHCLNAAWDIKKQYTSHGTANVQGNLIEVILTCVAVVQWLGHQTCTQDITGWLLPICNDSGQVVLTPWSSLSRHCEIIWHFTLSPQHYYPTCSHPCHIWQYNKHSCMMLQSTDVAPIKNFHDKIFSRHCPTFLLTYRVNFPTRPDNCQISQHSQVFHTSSHLACDTCTPVTEKYNLELVIWRQCSAGWEVTEGLA